MPEHGPQFAQSPAGVHRADHQHLVLQGLRRTAQTLRKRRAQEDRQAPRRLEQNKLEIGGSVTLPLPPQSTGCTFTTVGSEINVSIKENHMRIADTTGLTSMSVVAVLALCVGAAMAKDPKPPNALRVISYNIMVGFRVNGETRRKLDPARLKLAKQWIAAKDPDVVALQELNGITEDQLATIAHAWGHAYIKICTGASNYKVGITSKTPLSEIRVHEERDKDRPFLHGLLATRTSGVGFVVLHHNPFATASRLKEQKHILNEVDNLKKTGGYVIVLGDFNSRSKLDMPEDVSSDTRVMDNYMASGLVDVTASKGKQGFGKRGSIMTNVHKTGKNIAIYRYDFILATPSLAAKCIDAKVVNDDPDTDKISDHYPVIADFDLPKTE
jgi:exodeoxyribonuclease III